MPFVKNVIIRSIGQPHGESRFIDYDSALNKGYYRLDVLKVKVKLPRGVEEVELPYKEEINYIDSPNSRITIRGGHIDTIFDIGDKYRALTQPVFEEFMQAKPGTFDGPVLRLQSIKAVGRDAYECVLQRATYFDQIRTNLSLDMPIGLGRTMRIEDLSTDKQLRPLHQSLLANTIGVSAVWVTPLKHKDRKSRYQVFLKPRRRQTGVFYDMLGTVSGVVEVPEDDEFYGQTLEVYAKKEICREFYQETGYNDYMVANNMAESVVEIIPLAFTRELMRGGKPQFFFLIVTPSIAEKDLASCFKGSFNGPAEFYKGSSPRIRKFGLSPETQCNLLYALRYIQRHEHLEYIDLSD